MGVMSRRVLPVCAEIVCLPCPQLRPSSRKPVKRYKKFLSQIYAKAEAGSVDERTIGKLATYLVQNPDRIPKVANKLEVKGMAELTGNRHQVLPAVMACFTKIMAACPEHLSPLLGSALPLTRHLLGSSEAKDSSDTKGKNDLRLLACESLAKIFDCQLDSSFARNLESLLPAVLDVAAAATASSDPHTRGLRSATLHTLYSTIMFAERLSHPLPNTNQMITLILDNYQLPSLKVRDEDGQGLDEAASRKVLDASKRMKEEVAAAKQKAAEQQQKAAAAAAKGGGGGGGGKEWELKSVDESSRQQPEVAALLCVIALARLAARATPNVTRVADPLLLYFSSGSHWSVEREGEESASCLAADVLGVMRNVMATVDSSAASEMHLLAAVAKHAEGNGPKSAAERADVLAVLLLLLREEGRRGEVNGEKGGERDGGVGGEEAEDGKSGLITSAAVVEVQAMADVARVITRSAEECIRCLREGRDEAEEKRVQLRGHECLVELSCMVGDPRLILDMMAVMTESLPLDSIASCSILQSLALIATTLSEVSALRTALPETIPQNLLNELLQALLHPAAETRQAALLLLSELLRAESERDGGGGSKALEGEESEKGEGAGEESSKPSSERLERSFLRTLNSFNGLHAGGGARGAETSEAAENKTADIIPPNSRSMRLGVDQSLLLLSASWQQLTLSDNSASSFEDMSRLYFISLTRCQGTAAPSALFLPSLQLALSVYGLGTGDVHNDAQTQAMSSAFSRTLRTLSAAMLLAAANVFSLTQLNAVANDLFQAIRDPHFVISPSGLLSRASLAPSFPAFNSAEDCHMAAQGLASLAHADVASRASLAATIVETIEGDMPKVSSDDLLSPFTPLDSFALRPPLALPPPSPMPSYVQSADGKDSAFDDVIIPSADISSTQLSAPRPTGSPYLASKHSSASASPLPAASDKAAPSVADVLRLVDAVDSGDAIESKSVVGGTEQKQQAMAKALELLSGADDSSF